MSQCPATDEWDNERFRCRRSAGHAGRHDAGDGVTWRNDHDDKEEGEAT